MGATNVVLGNFLADKNMLPASGGQRSEKMKEKRKLSKFHKQKKNGNNEFFQEKGNNNQRF